MSTTVPNANVVFLPWVRQGAAAAINRPDTLGPNMRGAVDITATVTMNETDGVPVPVRLRGPADVVGIDANEIVRMDPKPNTADFEPNYFPAVEFDRPDFPWLFTPASAGAGAKLRPWLCLVVVRKQDGVVLTSTADWPLPMLQITKPAVPAEELPDLADSWAWVHAQVASSNVATPNELKTSIQTRPERSLSRLLCPRILQPNTDYIACVVPTFDLGRKAGRGEAITEADLTNANALQPAWSLTPPPEKVELPVYHHWRFRTGEGGDFESLVRLLRAVAAPEGLGTRPMDISRPGFELPETFPAEAKLALEGALRPMEAGSLPPWPEGVQQPFQTELAKIVNEPGLAQARDPQSDPLLAPPLYGQWHAAENTVSRDDTAWFDELNLDPRHRSVAAFGTRVVQEHQEALMAAAWDQAGDLEKANQRMRQLQLSLAASTSLHARHFSQLSPDAMLRITAPVLARVRGGTVAAPATRTMAAMLSGGALPLQAASTAMRRIARERGPITRRVAAQGVARSATPTWLVALNNLAALDWLTPSLPDLGTFGAIRARIPNPASLSMFSEVTAERIDNSNLVGRPFFRIVPEGQPADMTGSGFRIRAPDNPTAANFRRAAQTHLTHVNPGRLGMIFAMAPPFGMTDVRDALIERIAPRRTLVALAKAIVATSGNTAMSAALTAPTSESEVPIEQIMAAPKFPQPMYEPLRDLSQQLLLPGLETVEPNSVLGLETNPRFVEAYMVGLNHEMGRELLWRGFPTDQRGTYFDQFWDTRASAPADDGDNTFRRHRHRHGDIFAIHQWGTRKLGDPEGAPAGERFVMLMRSSLLRRYPTAVIYAVKAVKPGTKRMLSKDSAAELYPAFRGSMDPDVSFFGFNITADQAVGSGSGDDQGYFIVIQEQPGEPRFGVDVDTPLGGVSHLKVSAGVPSGIELNGMTWGQNGAHMAGILRQQPVRIAIHASQFLRPKQPEVPA
jgi:hypothetical protein